GDVLEEAAAVHRRVGDQQQTAHRGARMVGGTGRTVHVQRGRAFALALFCNDGPGAGDGRAHQPVAGSSCTPSSPCRRQPIVSIHVRASVTGRMIASRPRTVMVSWKPSNQGAEVKVSITCPGRLPPPWAWCFLPFCST